VKFKLFDPEKPTPLELTKKQSYPKFVESKGLLQYAQKPCRAGKNLPSSLDTDLQDISF